LQIDQKKPLIHKIGRLQLRDDPASLRISYDGPFSIGPGLVVEAHMSAQVFRNCQVILDYANQTLTVALPGALKTEGVPVPCRLNEQTGLIAITVSIGGHLYQ
jgi:hypothetical protein